MKTKLFLLSIILFWHFNSYAQLTTSVSVTSGNCDSRVALINISGGSGSYMVSAATTYSGSLGASTILSGNPSTSVNLTIPPCYDNITHLDYNLIVVDLATSAVSIPLAFVVSPIRSGNFSGITFPNVFTPNGDGVNDFFYPVVGGSSGTNKVLNAYRVEVQILDSGGLIYFQKTVDITGKPQNERFILNGDVQWNGNIGGGTSPAPGGTYFYAYKFYNCDNTSGVVRNAYITLLR